MSLRPMWRTAVRKKTYKVAVDADKARRKREDNMVEIRKSKREESPQKKRRELESLPPMFAGVWTDEPSLQQEATSLIGTFLSIEGTIGAGVVPRFVEFLKSHDFPNLQVEAARVLRKIALGTSEHTRFVIDHGAVPIFVQLLSSSSDDVRDQAVMALGSVARGSPKYRDLVLSHGALMPLLAQLNELTKLAQLNEHAKLSMLRNATWTLSNFCRGKPQPAFDLIEPALQTLEHVIRLISKDEEVLTYACWAVSYLSDGTMDKIKAMRHAGVFGRLVDLMFQPSLSVRILAVWTVNNIVTGAYVHSQLESLPAMFAGVCSDDLFLQLKAISLFRTLLSIDEVVAAGVVPCFVAFLKRHDNQQLQVEAARVLSKIALGTSEHTRVVIDCGAVPIFVQLLSSPSDDVREEAVLALGSLAGGSPICRDLVLSHGALMPLLVQLNEHAKLSMLRNATWTLSNFCRGKPQPAFDQTMPALPVLERLIRLNSNYEVLTYACWNVSCLSDGTHDKIGAMIKAGVFGSLLHLTAHPSPSVVNLARWTLGNILTGDDVQTQLQSLPGMVAGVWSDEPNQQLEATTQLRKLLSIERSPIKEVSEAGVFHRFVEFLTRNDFPQLQFEAAWALTNIVSVTSEHTRVVIEGGAVPIFVQLLSSPSDDVREQAVWALGNVAGDSPKCRDLVLSHGALMPLLAQLNEHAKLSMLRNATWTLFNFCRGKPQPAFDQTKPALPALERLIHSNDEEVLTDACWALSYLSDGTNDKIQAVIEAGVCRRLVELLLHPSPSVLIPALRTVGNIVTGDDLQAQYIINNQLLPCLLALLTHNHKKSIKKEACWTISNITAGNKDQIQAVIDANIIPPLVQLLQTAEFDIKKEAAWAISNATSGGTYDQIKYLVNQGCIKPLCDLLFCPDARIVTVCLEGLENILKVGEAEKDLGNTGGVNLYAQYIDDAEGLEKIENLQSHDNNEIYEKAVKILETYWLEDDEDDQTLPATGDAAQPTFNFGANQPTVPSGGFTFG